MIGEFTFTAELWGGSPEMGWVFASVPEDIADDIAELMPKQAGFGSVRVEVFAGSQAWKTSLFPDKARGTFVLPVKKAVRTGLGIDVGDRVTIRLRIIDDTAGGT